MKVLLLSLPSPFLLDEKVFCNLGILYIAAVLERRGIDVTVIDLAGERWKENLKDLQYDLIGISSTTPQFSYAVEALNHIKEVNPTVKVVIGGPHSSVDPQSCLDVAFDFVVVGEGERAIVKIVSGCKDRMLQEPFIDNLDDIPFPARHLVNMSSYHYYLDGVLGTNIIASRGCPYNCAFCCKALWGRRVRFRSVENVVLEVLILKEEFGIERLMFFDDEFNLNHKRTLRICEAFKPLKIKWRCFIRADLFDAKLGKAMKEAGCVEVGCGVESGSQRILNNIHKGTTVHQNSEARRLCKELAIRFKAFLVLGLPGENLESVNATREWVRRNEPDDFDVTIFTPYPGSPIWEKPELYDIRFDKDAMRENFYSQSFYKGPPKSWVSTKSLSANELVRLRDQIEDEFNRKIRSRWLWESPSTPVKS